MSQLFQVIKQTSQQALFSPPLASFAPLASFVLPPFPVIRPICSQILHQPVLRLLSLSLSVSRPILTYFLNHDYRGQELDPVQAAEIPKLRTLAVSGICLVQFPSGLS